MADIIRFKRGTYDKIKDYTPDQGEPIYDKTYKSLRIGDGSTPVNELPEMRGMIVNPANEDILPEGVIGWDKTSNILKIGDGVTNWESLPEINSQPVINTQDTQNIKKTKMHYFDPQTYIEDYFTITNSGTMHGQSLKIIDDNHFVFATQDISNHRALLFKYNTQTKEVEKTVNLTDSFSGKDHPSSLFIKDNHLFVLLSTSPFTNNILVKLDFDLNILESTTVNHHFTGIDVCNNELYGTLINDGGIYKIDDNLNIIEQVFPSANSTQFLTYDDLRCYNDYLVTSFWNNGLRRYGMFNPTTKEFFDVNYMYNMPYEAFDFHENYSIALISNNKTTYYFIKTSQMFLDSPIYFENDINVGAMDPSATITSEKYVEYDQIAVPLYLEKATSIQAGSGEVFIVLHSLKGSAILRIRDDGISEKQSNGSYTTVVTGDFTDKNIVITATRVYVNSEQISLPSTLYAAYNIPYHHQIAFRNAPIKLIGVY